MSIRYASFSDNELQAFLTALIEQSTSGVASISYNGQTITYSSPANIDLAIVGLEDELKRRKAAAAGLKKKSGVLYPSMPGKGFI